ncbi:MAG: damage-inducible protein DinB [Rhodobacter sp.]|nr:damage-inducible protein DinB [Rhodobacter sp.]
MPGTDPQRVFRKLAMANRLANARLHRICALLPVAEMTAPRPAFFGSIQATLNHILLVDRFYLTALEGGRLNKAALEEARHCPDLATLALWQAASDMRLLAHVEELTEAALCESVAVDRGERVQHDRRDDLLSHVFQHQTHHRGQIHGMLSATSVPPPQLDEFIVGDDAAARAEDVAILGWSEDRLMR